MFEKNTTLTLNFRYTLAYNRHTNAYILTINLSWAEKIRNWTTGLAWSTMLVSVWPKMTYNFENGLSILFSELWSFAALKSLIYRPKNVFRFCWSSNRFGYNKKCLWSNTCVVVCLAIQSSLNFLGKQFLVQLVVKNENTQGAKILIPKTRRSASLAAWSDVCIKGSPNFSKSCQKEVTTAKS